MVIETYKTMKKFLDYSFLVSFARKILMEESWRNLH